MKKLIALPLVLLSAVLCRAQEAAPPVRIAIYGLVHDHARGMIPRFTGRTDVVLAGIVEPDAALAAKYAREYHLDSGLFYPTLEALLAKTK